MWLGLVGGGVARWIRRGAWESWKQDQGLPSNLIWSIRRDRKGALWVGTGDGLARLGDSGQIRTWTRKDGLGGDNVRWLAETSDGSLWAATKPGGLARIDASNGEDSSRRFRGRTCLRPGRHLCRPAGPAVGYDLVRAIPQ